MNHSQPSTSPFPAPENMDASYMNNGLLSDIESSDKMSDLTNETSYHNVNDSPIQGFGSVASGSMSNSNHTCCSTYRDRENLKKGNQYYIIFLFFYFLDIMFITDSVSELLHTMGELNGQISSLKRSVKHLDLEMNLANKEIKCYVTRAEYRSNKKMKVATRFLQRFYRTINC